MLDNKLLNFLIGGVLAAGGLGAAGMAVAIMATPEPPKPAAGLIRTQCVQAVEAIGITVDPAQVSGIIVRGGTPAQGRAGLVDATLVALACPGWKMAEFCAGMACQATPDEPFWRIRLVETDLTTSP